MPTSILLQELTREQVRTIAPGATAILPTASTEQHGPHLPLEVDSLACTAVCRGAAELARAEIPIVVAPTLVFGWSRSHFPLPGVLTLSAKTFLQVVLELGESLYRSGFRRIAIINGHGSHANDPLVRAAASDLADNFPLSVCAASYWTIAWEALFKETGTGDLRRVPGHGGTFETAVTMALRPDLVDHTAMPETLDEREGVPPVQPNRPVVRFAGIKTGTGPGYTDDPRAATAEAGRRYLETMYRAVAAFLLDFHRRHPQS